MTGHTPPKKGIGTYKYYMLIPTAKDSTVFSYLVIDFGEGYATHGYFLITEIMSSKHLSTEKLLENLLESLTLIRFSGLNDYIFSTVGNK